MAKVKHPVVLLILDGWGYSEDSEFNAIRAAATPVWDDLWAHRAHTLLQCSGFAVGLPDQQMGNSEVGHMHIGAGRLIDQDFTRIGKAIANGDFARNAVLRDACDFAAGHARAVHIMGLLSPGGVHSHEDHILALIDLAHAQGAKQIFVHAFLDGRDTPPRSAADSLARVAAHCATLGNTRIASIIGRYYAMDRNQNWDRTAIAYRLLVDANAAYSVDDAQEGLRQAYQRGENDEFVAATVVTDGSGHKHRIEDGDVVFFANFRADRARQITTAMTVPECAELAGERHPALGRFVTMTDYGEQFALPTAFPSSELRNTFGAVLADHGLRQLRIAETEKYAHVTFFFNGGEEQAYPGEDRELVPSPDVATYDLMPQMSAPEVTERLCAAIAAETYDAIICNYANADMVGHTGNFDATVQCVETLDRCIGKVISVAQAHGTEILITADHGNAEKMRDGNDASTAHTAHTSNLVPLIYLGRAARLRSGGSLVDLAPTMLSLLELEIPAEMTGTPLLRLGASTQDAA